MLVSAACLIKWLIICHGLSQRKIEKIAAKGGSKTICKIS